MGHKKKKTPPPPTKSSSRIKAKAQRKNMEVSTDVTQDSKPLDANSQILEESCSSKMEPTSDPTLETPREDISTMVEVTSSPITENQTIDVPIVEHTEEMEEPLVPFVDFNIEPILEDNDIPILEEETAYVVDPMVEEVLEKEMAEANI
ncbi:unnamed protein product [Cuscuta epithymum]|uniref:Uncharacterized protein n=1 Tax=Cuscuta epithymum TaxID=186058 RepID=A0AAV0F953_9ASTE|nr:unnamed protein product [Cuscuta epithymum]